VSFRLSFPAFSRKFKRKNNKYFFPQVIIKWKNAVIMYPTELNTISSTVPIVFSFPLLFNLLDLRVLLDLLDLLDLRGLLRLLDVIMLGL